MSHTLKHRVVTVALLLGFCSITAFAQIDSLTSIKIYVKDFSGKYVTNVEFKIHQFIGEKSVPYEIENVFKVDDAFVVHLGLETRGTFLVEILADGFERLPFTVVFQRGHMQTVNAKLRRSGVPEISEIERITNLRGQVLDYTGSLITNAKVVAVDENGKRFETASSPNGYFELRLPFRAFIWDAKLKKWIGDSVEPSRYDISMTAPGFKAVEFKQLVLTNGARGNLNIDVVLALQEPSPGGAIIQK